MNPAEENEYVIGPGSDLLVALVTIMMILFALRSDQARKTQVEVEELRTKGKFRLSEGQFLAGDFAANPVDSLVNPAEAHARIGQIVDEYRRVKDKFPFIYVVGHANRSDDPRSADKSESRRRQRNWNYGGRRGAAIAGALSIHLDEEERENLVILSSGEQDLRFPSRPYALENAWVEIVFGMEWKLPSARMAGTEP